jgi:hypothetical protein
MLKRMDLTQTAVDMVLAIKRIHKRLGVPIDVLPSVRSTFQGLARQYVEKNGPDADGRRHGACH